MAGSAFALQRWNLVPGTSIDEGVKECRDRMGWPLMDNGRVRRGDHGVSVLEGIQEIEWLAQWEARIRQAVVLREHCNNLLL